MRALPLLALLALTLGCRTKVEVIDADADGYPEELDCDDNDAAVHPGAVEVCNGVDDDCDGDADGTAVDLSTWYADADDDGHGDPTLTAEACEAPEGYVDTSDDCNDDEALAWTGHEEECDGIDNDCDGELDEGFEITNTWYADTDGDGWGDAEAPVFACDQPPDTSTDDTDCDDTRADVHPEGTEVCDGADNDCNGLVDDEAVDMGTWYMDYDGDGYGVDTWTTLACEMPEGYADNADDCDDTSALALPGGTEVCDGLDNDCDAELDEDDALDASTWYADDDGDGYGDPDTAWTSCEAPGGWISDSSDCDDTDALVYPGAVELCDGEDDDCDGTVDEDDAADALTWYADTDGDGFGDESSTTPACEQPSGYVSDDTDCDDTDGDVNPGAGERCDGGTDEDCDGEVDEDSAVDADTWYIDYDADSYGSDAYTTEACDQPSGYVDSDDDCDDTRDEAYPGADETCNDEDDDCDGSVDEEAVDFETFYADSDSDGYGDSSTTEEACEASSGYTDDDSDCDDTDASIHPGADETCDEVDEDCDGDVDEDPIDGDTWYMDADGDGYGVSTYTTQACDQPSGYADNADDCDDTDASDTDGDGTQDCADDDIDGDGLSNDWDADPYDDTVIRPLTEGSGADGALTVSGTEVLGDWTLLTSGATAGDTSLVVDDTTAFAADDEVLVLSQQGTDAGLYQFLMVSAVTSTTLTVQPPLENSYSSSSTVLVLRVPHYTDVSVPSGTTLTADAWSGGGGVLAFRATGDVDISGTLTASSLGFAGGAGVYGNTYSPYQGESWSGLGASGDYTANAGGGGAYPRRGDNGDSGGGGGYGSTGDYGTNYYGSNVTAGGLTYGDAALTELHLGSGGGGGSPDTESDGSSTANYAGAGGAGGGVVLIFAGTSLDVSGSVLAEGQDGDNAVDSGGEVGGGGAGSGGTIWLASPDLVLSGTVSALGGAGGRSGCGGCGTTPYGSAMGGDGGDGRVKLQYDTISGSTSPTAGSTGIYE